MNTISRVSVAALVAATALSAQGRTGLDCDLSAYTSRHGVPAGSTGDCLHRIDHNILAGVGTSAGDTVSGFRFVLQDQDLATPEDFNIVVYSDDGAGAPLIGSEMRSGNFQLAAGSGGGAFIVTVSFATPVMVPGNDWFHGVGLSANAAWPATDGLSIQGGDYSGAAGSAQVSNPNAPGVTFAVDTTAGAVAFANLPRVMRCDIISDGAGLKGLADVNGSGPVPGIAGSYQDRARDDGFGFQVSDAGNAGETFAIIGQILGPTLPVSLGFLEGDLYLNPTLFFPTLLGSGNLDANGDAAVVSFPAPLVLGASYGVISAQGVVDILGNNGMPRLTNMVIMQDA